MTAPRLLLLDNVDSFTFMLADSLRVAGAEVIVERNDALDVAQAMAAGRDAIVISPGPGGPKEAGISVPLASECVERRRPLLGVCLGHQALGLACGARIGRVAPMHGKIAMVEHDGSGLLAGLPSPFEATLYHSLALSDLPEALVANAWSGDGVMMAMRHRFAPAYGVQFHPESIATPHGSAIIAAFVAAAREGA
ncbi:MAG: aminodeoxychorismate/anthranilate synthase component II [Pseudomonadota bacterium]|nr:aminodeoxychorismate/anthranilate synthase component II [Pseudomonadota bacterium]